MFSILTTKIGCKIATRTSSSRRRNETKQKTKTMISRKKLESTSYELSIPSLLSIYINI